MTGRIRHIVVIVIVAGLIVAAAVVASRQILLSYVLSGFGGAFVWPFVRLRLRFAYASSCGSLMGVIGALAVVYTDSVVRQLRDPTPHAFSGGVGDELLYLVLVVAWGAGVSFRMGTRGDTQTAFGVVAMTW